MKTIRFFATPEELHGFIEQWREKFHLCIGLVEYHSIRRVRPLGNGETLAAVWNPLHGLGTEFRELWLSTGPLDISGTNDSEVRDKNRNVLSLDLPEQESGLLTEASLGTVTTDEAHLKQWKKIVSDVKKATDPGMWISDRAARNKSFYKVARYTKGASSLAQNGWGLRSFEGFDASVDEPRF